MPEFPEFEHDEQALAEEDVRLDKPGMFKVLLHNDDYTTMEFVVFVLNHVFKRSPAESVTIMLKVHNEGVGVAGVYPYEIAKEKADKAMNMARAREFPFLCTVEQE